VLVRRQVGAGRSSVRSGELPVFCVYDQRGVYGSVTVVIVGCSRSAVSRQVSMVDVHDTVFKYWQTNHGEEHRDCTYPFHVDSLVKSPHAVSAVRDGE
jgi:hypothetical protein